MNTKSQRGFTIIELMIAVGLFGVLATLAAPSFSSILKQNRIASQTNTILTSLNYARSETINQNNNVVVQPNVAGTNWSTGWQVNINGNLMRQFEGVDNGSLTSSVATLTYQSNGSITAGAPVTLTLTPTSCTTGKPDVRIITVALSGQASSAKSNCP